jgi:hypothetical protein
MYSVLNVHVRLQVTVTEVEAVQQDVPISTGRKRRATAAVDYVKLNAEYEAEKKKMKLEASNSQ